MTSNRRFEEMFQSPSFHNPNMKGTDEVFVAADTYDQGSSDAIHLIVVKRFREDLTPRDNAEGKMACDGQAGIELSVAQARCIADMLSRAADTLDPRRKDLPENEKDHTFTLTPWFYGEPEDAMWYHNPN